MTNILFFDLCFTFSLCTFTQPGILTIGVPARTVTGTTGGIACGGSVIHTLASAIALTPIGCIVEFVGLIVPTNCIPVPFTCIASAPVTCIEAPFSM